MFLMVVILLTGNYTFFNWLALALCLLLLDDFAFRKLLPKTLPSFFLPNIQALKKIRWHIGVTIIPVAIVFISISFLQIVATLGLRADWLFQSDRDGG